MTNRRYGSSFLISSLIYFIVGLSLYTLAEKPIEPIKIPERPIKIAIVTPKPKPKVVKPTPIVPKKREVVKPKPKPKKVVKKSKPKPKKITKKVIKKVVKKHVSKPKPKPKKVTKRVIKKVQPIQEEIYIPEPQEIIEETFTKPTPIEAPPSPVVAQPVATQPKVDKSAKRRAFLHTVRSKIVRNKKYPARARRRHIEGSVEVMFDIGTDGSISNIQFLNGKRILQKSVRKAVLSSSPLSIPHSLKSELPMYGISLVVHFKLN